MERGDPCLVLYIDNNSARDVLISADARTPITRGVLKQILKTEDQLGVLAWYARVPSDLNVSDGPSRNDVKWLALPGDPG